MKQHRDTCKQYAKAYQTKLTAKKCPLEVEEQINEYESKLDIFNLVIIRQQIEMEVERLAEKEKTMKAKRGWFGFLWGSPQEEEVHELNTAAAISEFCQSNITLLRFLNYFKLLVKKFEEAMTPAEKEKLYRAIGYQENTAPAHYPETFEEMDISFFLHGLQIILLDTDKEHPQVLDLLFSGVKAGFKSRPSANGIS